MINEYTDWSRPVEHPVNLFDSLVDILGDALVVAGMVQTGDLNAHQAAQILARRHHHVNGSKTDKIAGPAQRASARTFFYVFSYQNDNAGQRLGCQHGEELHYLFGAPLAAELLGRPIGHFSDNYSRQEGTLTEAVMTYWSNFVKFG